ncbi:hypothetical protein SESBI_21182 [Sesbania bispinosa]|nr:hypothetical protein SESBI_21182 [Sesbania bispinosa]
MAAVLGLDQGETSKGLLPEEEDNLARSNKKGKVSNSEDVSQNDTVIPETQEDNVI